MQEYSGSEKKMKWIVDLFEVSPDVFVCWIFKLCNLNYNSVSEWKKIMKIVSQTSKLTACYASLLFVGQKFCDKHLKTDQ